MSKQRKPSRKHRHILPSGRDTPEQQIPLPSLHREDMLPLLAVGSVKFEKLCRDVLRHRFPDTRRYALKRDSGQQQFGADVEGFDATGRTAVVISCKCWRDVKGRFLLPWVEEFTTHLDGHWKDCGIRHFVLAVTHPGNADEISKAARACHDHLARFGIAFELWDMLTITDLLRQDVELVDRYFHRVWVEAISPRPHAVPEPTMSSPAIGAHRSAAIQELAAEIGRVARQRDDAIGRQIDAANTEFRAGRPGALIRCLDDLEADAALWATLEQPIKAKALKARAMLALNGNDVRAAGLLLDQADALAPAPDRTARAWHIRATQSAVASLAFLSAPLTRRETEAKAALHLDQRQPDAAIALLEGLAGSPSSEQLRLRALAECLLGRRADAVATAAAACAAPPYSIAAMQTHAILHVMAALSDRAEPQLGSMPNPFSPALVKGSRDALEHLDRALALLDALIPTVEASIVADLEVWKLATLLIHPIRSIEARAFADILLARPDPEPLAVAWCHSTGLKIRVGRIRKAFEDALRKGLGTPTHAVVLALLAAERRGPQHAVATLARHRHRFPDADGFLTEWQARFEGTAGESEFARAMHAAEQSTHYAPLVRLIAAHPCTANEILLAAGLLAARRAWTDLDRIRTQLIKVGTPRAIDLAARAALESRSPADATAILDRSRNCFLDGELPTSLEYLRARALDEQGRKGAAITALTIAASRSDDPGVTRQLIHSLVGIGHLREARRRAEHYVRLPSTGPLELVHLAQAFRSVDAAFSRTLVETAMSSSSLPARAAPAVMMLARQLGLADADTRMMQVIATATKDGSASGIIRFDRIEDVLAFMEKRGAELERDYAGWLAGGSLAHLTFDAQTLASLHCADPRDRLNALRRPMPMLLRGGGVAPRAIPVPAEGVKPQIILDLSALLIADRCALLPEIESAFSIRVPASLPLALVGIEDNWQEASPALITAGRSFLAASETAVRTVEQMPAEAVPLDIEDKPYELDPTLITATCRAAVAAGVMPRDIAQKLSSEQSAPMPAPAALALAPWSLLRLAAAGALEPIASSLPTYLSCADRRSLEESLARAERSIAVYDRLTRLRELVADRLVSEAWTTLPCAAMSRSPKADRLPPHILGLVDIIETVNAEPSTLVWIEDRALSRARPPLSTSIVEVLDHLRAQALIDEARHCAVDRLLRDMGYAFMPVPAARIAHDVARATIDGGVLVETPELAHWRRWFAAEVDRLQHASQAPEPDATGRIAGEPRHLLSMLSAARDVMAHIWADPAASIEDKRARSEWIWTCLRFESTAALPWSTANPAARLALAATVLFHAADVPLMAGLGVDELPREVHQPYIDWFTSSVLDPRSAIDPALGDGFARHVASLLAAHLGEDSDNGDQPAGDAELRGYLITRYRRFLQLFPGSWREKFLSHCDLAAKLGIVSVLTVEVGGVDITAEAITVAIAAALPALADASSTAPLSLPDEGQALLSLCRAANGVLEAEIDVRGNKAQLDPVVVALSLSDAAARSAALAAIPQVLDLSAAALPGALAHIAEPRALADRVGRLRAAQVHEFRRHLNRVHARLAEESKFEITDLALPAPEAIAQYLRLPDPFRAEPGPWLEEIARGLAGDLGAKAAARRCGAVPFDLPASLFLVRSDLAPAKADHAESDLQVEITSPAHALLRLRSLAKSGAPDGIVAPLVKVLLDRLDSQAGLMAALLRKGARHLARSESWSRLHPQIALTLLWVWADRLASTFAAQPVDMPAMIRIVEQTEPAELTHVLDRTRFPSWFYDFAVDVDEAALKGSFAAAALKLVPSGTLPDDLMTRLLSAFGHVSGDAWYPKFEIAAPRNAAPAGLWIARDPVAAVHAASVRAVPGALAERDPDGYVSALVAEPAKDDQPFLIVGLLSFLDVSAVSAATAEIVIAHVGDVQARNGARSNDPGYRRCYGIKAAALGRTGARSALEKEMASLARAFRSNADARIGYAVFEQDNPAGRQLTLLLEMALAYVRHCPEPPVERVKMLGALAQVIVDAWPASVRGVIAFLDRTVEILPVELNVHIWPALLELRAR